MAGVAAGAAAAGGLYALDRVANQVFRPVHRPPAVSVPELGYRHEDLAIPAGDHTLRGWLVCPTDPGSRPLVVLAHGWGANYGTFLRLAESLVGAGHPVILFDVQGHGRSGPAPYITVRHFRDDVAAVARYAAQRFPGRRRVLVGHSMGGAAAVLAAEMGAPVDALVAVAAPANVLEVIASYLRDKGYPGGLMVVALRPFWWLRVGGTTRHLIPERKIGAVRLPVLILQPEHDHRVPREHAERLARAAGAAYHLISGTGHTDVLDAAETHARVLAFLQELPGPEAP